MNWEQSYYIMGTFFFTFAFVLLIVLIIASLLILKNINKLQVTVQQALEEKKSLTTMIPMMLVGMLEARSFFRRFR